MDKHIHPLTLLSISSLFILAIFLKIALMKLLILYIMILPYIQPNSEAVYNYFRKLLIIFFAVCSLVGLKLLYAHESSTTIFQYAVRLFLLFTVSMLSFSAIDFDKLFVYLMSSKKIKVSWGYPLLLAMNSLQLLKDEQERIAFNAKIRQLKWHQRYLVFFPVLVFAIRHSERGAMALVTRGLSSDKLFFHVSKPTKRDLWIFLSYFLLTITFFLAG